MKYASKMAQAIALMREHAREQADKVGAREAHRDLMFAMRTLLEEFRVEFDVPGTHALTALSETGAWARVEFRVLR